MNPRSWTRRGIWIGMSFITCAPSSPPYPFPRFPISTSIKIKTQRKQNYQIPKDDFVNISNSPSPTQPHRSHQILHPRLPHHHHHSPHAPKVLKAHLILLPGTLQSLHNLHEPSGGQISFTKSPPQPPLKLRTAMGKHTDFSSLIIFFNCLGGLQILLLPLLTPGTQDKGPELM